MAGILLSPLVAGFDPTVTKHHILSILCDIFILSLKWRGLDAMSLADIQGKPGIQAP
jgi:hypothetical protein